MSRWWRGLLALLVLTVAIAGVGSGSSPSAAQGDEEPAATGAPDTPDGDPAIDSLVGCVQASRGLLVLFLIDESASLKVSDPENRRVDAAQGALASLLALATAEGDASPEVDVAFAAFSNEYRTVQDWTAATEDSAEELEQALDGFAPLNDGIDTDFVNALSSGREALAERSAELTVGGGTPPCRAVLLFTDGGFDLAVRESAEDQERLGTTKPYAPGIELTTDEAVQEAEAAGRRALCEPGGLADRLRSDEITLLTLALSGDVARRSQLPLAAATSGSADDYTCGTPSERTQGAYLPAEGVDVLVARFNEVGSRLGGGNLLPSEGEAEVCGAEPCPEGSQAFTLDASLRRAQILALPPEPGAIIRVVGPDGDPVDLTEAATVTIGATEVVAEEVAGRGLRLNLERPEDLASWEGEWTVSILDPSDTQVGEPATLQVFVYSDIGVALTEVSALVRGGPTTMVATLSVPEGVLSEGLVAEATGEVRIRNPITADLETVPLTGPPEGPYTATYEVPADLTSNALELIAEVRLTTTSGAALISQAPRREELVQRPAGSIQILPSSLSLPSLTGEGTTETDLLFKGGSAPGCVWFGPTDVPEPPEGADPVVLLVDGEPLPDEADCLAVAADETLTVRIQAQPSGRASGTVRGTLQVFERVEGVDASSQTDLAFRFDLARGVDEATRAVAAAVLLLAGLALPMFALLVINAVTARFQTLDVVRGAALPVLVSRDTTSRMDGDFPKSLAFRPDDFGSLAGLGNDRRFRFGGVEFRAKASRNPFGATIAMAAPEGGAEKLKGHAGSRVALDPGLAGSWVFLLDPTKTRKLPPGDAEGLLIAFVAEGDIGAQAGRMLSDVQARLPSTAARLAGLVRASSTRRSKGPAADSTPEGPDDDDEPSPSAPESTGT